MKLELGIDTGGSYTDAVLINCDTGEVIGKTKAKTTKEDLTIGIQKAIDQLHIEPMSCISLVFLSTTLATNAVIEEKGAAVGLITIEAPDDRRYPAAYRFDARGKINVKGCEVTPLDTEHIEEFLYAMQGKIEALAVSGYAASETLYTSERSRSCPTRSWIYRSSAPMS